MSRKNLLSTIYPRDVKVFKALAACGHASYDQLREFVRDKRLRTYEKAGLVGRIPLNRPGNGSGDRTCYRLTTAGREFCRHELHFSGMYKTQSVAHYMGIADRYFSLSPAERATWKTESQVQTLYERRIEELRDQGEEELAQSLWNLLEQGEVSPPDAVYTTEAGELVVLEIVTNNYGEAELQEKTAFVEAVGIEADSIDFVRI